MDRSLKVKPYNNTIVLDNNSIEINCDISRTQPNIEYLLQPEKANKNICYQFRCNLHIRSGKVIETSLILIW